MVVRALSLPNILFSDLTETVAVVRIERMCVLMAVIFSEGVGSRMVVESMT